MSRVSRCARVTVRGITDTYSWCSGGTPLLFDGDHGKKPAYDAVLAALGRSGGGDGGGGAGDGTVSRTATCTRAADRSTGCNGQVTITAGSKPVTSWSTPVALTPPQQVSATWNGSPSWDASGTGMTVRPSGNGSLAAGTSTSFGFTVAKNGSTTAPAVGTRTAARIAPRGRQGRT
ncbi:cellulose binding domain-containing protein [Streptomyces flaveolus]|uniref:cellulose binding domain-containing protein n=2 Tax=Streptomyces flaveolus TaxID=67297 RepID=UPI0037F3EB00